MVAYVVAVFFFVTLFLVVTRKKARLKKLLNDDDVPFPAAGQASTIFSLTALFAAYTAPCGGPRQTPLRNPVHRLRAVRR